LIAALEGQYLTSESDPVFSSHTASSITASNVENWEEAYSWGDHATAGYLTGYSETDPLFASSPAAGVGATDITNWNEAYSWGNHMLVGYLTSENDPKVGNITANYVPRWSGSSLETGVLYDNNGMVGVGTENPQAMLDVGGIAKIGTDVDLFVKSCTFSAGTIYTDTRPSVAACQTHCIDMGYEGGVVRGEGSRSCSGNPQCIYVSDFENCTISTRSNDGLCGCSATHACICTYNSGSMVDGELRILNGNVGIGTSAPRSRLHVNGYIQLSITSGAPPSADCDEVSDRGRMKVDSAAGVLWICVNSGWISK
jgi:hypothetical protein